MLDVCCVPTVTPAVRKTSTADAVAVQEVGYRKAAMTSDVQSEIGTDSSGTRDERQARRIAELHASDPQFRAAEPLPQVIDAARQPGLRLGTILQTLVDGYADRP